jgi:hypothetical protein
VEVRFVLPIVPFLIIASAPAWGALAQRSRTAAMALLIPCICYGLLASGWVGYRFATDPRMAAQSWVAQNVPADAVIESSDYTPVWNYFPGVHVKEVRMPSVSARYRHFAKLFVNEPRMLELLAKSESDEGVDWYTEKSLLERQPDFISVDSAYYRRFFGDAAADYPEVRDYLQRLMDGNLGYEVAFDRGSSRVPTWLYPQDIAFVDNRILILRRSAH